MQITRNDRMAFRSKLKKLLIQSCSLPIIRIPFAALYYFLFKCYQECLYSRYRQKYDVASSFEFAGDNIQITGGTVKLGSETHIADNSRIVCSAGQKVIIGDHCRIGPHVAIYTTNTRANQDFSQSVERREGDVVIGDFSWIGYGTVIIENVTIGKNCVIGANSVVNKDIPDFSIAAGCPIKILSTINNRNH